MKTKIIILVVLLAQQINIFAQNEYAFIDLLTKYQTNEKVNLAEEEFFFGEIEVGESAQKYFTNDILYSNENFAILYIAQNIVHGGDEGSDIVARIASYDLSGKLISQTTEFYFGDSECGGCTPDIGIIDNAITLGKQCEEYGQEFDENEEMVSDYELQNENSEEFYYFFNKKGILFNTKDVIKEIEKKQLEINNSLGKYETSEIEIPEENTIFTAYLESGNLKCIIATIIDHELETIKKFYYSENLVYYETTDIEHNAAIDSPEYDKAKDMINTSKTYFSAQSIIHIAINNNEKYYFNDEYQYSDIIELFNSYFRLLQNPK